MNSPGLIIVSVLLLVIVLPILLTIMNFFFDYFE